MKARLLFLAFLLLAGGIYYSATHESIEEGIEATGTVVQIRRDAQGCGFALHRECRYMVKIRHHLTGGPANVEQSYIHVETYKISPGPAVSEGDTVKGVCRPNGRCHFTELDAPKGQVLVVSLALLVFVLALGRYFILRFRARSS